MVEVNRSLPLGKKLIFKNNPSTIIVLDSRNKSIDIESLDRVHRALGMKMFGYHYFISKNGEIFSGRPEKAFSCDVEVLMQDIVKNEDTTSNASPFAVSDLEYDTPDNIISAGRIFICLEGHTEASDITEEQRSSLIALCKDIRARYRNVNSIYSLADLVPKFNNLGVFVDFNKIRSEIMSSVIPTYVNTPAGTISYTYGKRNLEYIYDNPISGNDVKLLQLYLIKMGVPIENPTGEFDLFTHEAVIKFQNMFSLKPTGVVGEEEYAKINEVLYNVFRKSKDYSQYHRMLYFRENNQMIGEDVDRLQEKLAGLRLATKSGKFDVQTDIGIRRFQSDNGLTADGMVGPITWKTLMKSVDVDFHRIIKFTEPNMQGGDIKLIQERIRDFRKRFGIIQYTVNGVYDKVTYGNIKRIQSKTNFPIDGVVDELLFNFLMDFGKKDINSNL